MADLNICPSIKTRTIDVTSAMESDGSYTWVTGFSTIYFALPVWGNRSGGSVSFNAANQPTFSVSGGTITVSENTSGAWDDSDSDSGEPDELMIIAIGA